MQYPLQEKIGQPELLVGRKKMFGKFDKWLNNIPRKLSKSRVILARRKSGKTAFMQRIFNNLWSQNGQVIPFYLDIGENNIWYPDFAIKYYQTFASHYISFLERDPILVKNILTLEKIKEYGHSKGIEYIVDDVNFLQNNQAPLGGSHDLMWDIAYSAPHRYADVTDRRVLVMIDEFQNITQYIYPDPQYQTQPIETMAGSFHYYSESKIAPMLVTGSYVGWLITIISKYLEAGRLSHVRMSPYLEKDEGLEAVYRYAEVYQEPITNYTAVLINELCMFDPFFISCVILSDYEEKDLTTEDGVVGTVNYEITDRESEMSRTWAEYIQLTLKRVNDLYAKSMLLYLNQHKERDWTPQELKDKLYLPLEKNDIQEKLLTLAESDMIARGTSDIDFRGLQDGTLNLVLRNRFEKEIRGFKPDIKHELHEQVQQLKGEKRSLKGRISYLEGMLAENLLAGELRSKKRFRLSDYFAGAKDNSELNIIELSMRLFFQRSDGKNGEIDLLAQSKDGRVVMIEVKKRQDKIGHKEVEDFLDKVIDYARVTGKVVLPAFLSLGGFTEKAKVLCTKEGIGIAEQIQYSG